MNNEPIPNVKMSADPDASLVKEAKQGSRVAYGKLVERYYQMVYAVVFGVLGRREASLDVTQDVFLKLLHEIVKFAEKSKFKTWLYRIAVNAAIDCQRRLKPMVSIDLTDASDDENEAPFVLVEGSDGPREAACQVELKEMMERALARLSVEQKAILVLREWQGLSYEEIAEVLQIEQGTVMSRLFYARKKMGEILGKKAEEKNYEPRK